MIRWLFTTASVVSLIGSCALLIAWATSPRHRLGMRVEWTTVKDTHWGDLPVQCTSDLSVGGGTAVWSQWNHDGINFFDPRTHRLYPVRAAGPTFHLYVDRIEPVSWMQLIGGQWFYINKHFIVGETEAHSTVLVIPIWAAVILLGALPLARLSIVWNAKRGLRAGLCRVCGDDLRASKERCPECGAALSRTITEIIA